MLYRAVTLAFAALIAVLIAAKYRKDPRHAVVFVCLAVGFADLSGYFYKFGDQEISRGGTALLVAGMLLELVRVPAKDDGTVNDPKPD